LVSASYVKVIKVSLLNLHFYHFRRIESYEQYFSSTKCHLTFINSSVFGHEDDPGTKWTLQLFPKGDKEASSNAIPGTETISFFINLDKSSDMPELPAKYSVEILGNLQQKRCHQFEI
jgi:hypothetical protein